MEGGGELFMEDAAVERGMGRPLAPAGGYELFLGSGMRCGSWGSEGGGGADASMNESASGDAIDKPEMSEVGVKRVELTADAVPGMTTGVRCGAAEGKG